jgi:hypothetical protein
MSRSVPVFTNQSPGNPIASATWNTQVVAGGKFATNPPCARLRGVLTAQSIATGGAGTPVAYTVADLDTDAGWASATPSRYVCQVPGWYSVSAYVSFASNATGTRVVSLAKNGANLDGTVVGVPANSASSTSITTGQLVQLAAGDYLECWVAQTSGAALAISSIAGFAACLNLDWVHA